jgi:hypothetical protein
MARRDGVRTAPRVRLSGTHLCCAPGLRASVRAEGAACYRWCSNCCVSSCVRHAVVLQACALLQAPRPCARACCAAEHRGKALRQARGRAARASAAQRSCWRPYLLALRAQHRTHARRAGRSVPRVASGLACRAGHAAAGALLRRRPGGRAQDGTRGWSCLQLHTPRAAHIRQIRCATRRGRTKMRPRRGRSARLTRASPRAPPARQHSCAVSRRREQRKRPRARPKTGTSHHDR